jgi:hypothetical protein
VQSLGKLFEWEVDKITLPYVETRTVVSRQYIIHKLAYKQYLPAYIDIFNSRSLKRSLLI